MTMWETLHWVSEFVLGGVRALCAPPPLTLPVGWGVLVGVGGCLRSPLDGVESGVLCTSLKVRECLRGGGWGSLRSPEGQGVFEG